MEISDVGGDEAAMIDDYNLPEWFLYELLCKLPQKTVHKFKCVSKQCLSFISDPSFFPSYFSRRGRGEVAPPPCPLIFFSSRIELLEEDPLLLPPPPPLQLDVEFPQFHSFTLSTDLLKLAGGAVEIKAADKGFLLLGRDFISKKGNTTRFYICNGLTKECFAVPRSRKILIEGFIVGFIAMLDDDGVLNGYRIVIIQPSDFRRKNFNVHMFCSESERWVDHEVKCDSRVIVRSCGRGFVVNNALHWMIHDSTDRGISHTRILIYAPYVDCNNLRIVHAPVEAELEEEEEGNTLVEADLEEEEEGEGERGYIPSVSGCGVSRGRLKFFKVRVMGMEIWELQDSSNNNKWCHQHTMKTEDILNSYFLTSDMMMMYGMIGLLEFKHVKLIGFHPLDPNIVYLYYFQVKLLVSYNMGTKKAKFTSVSLIYRGGNSFSGWCDSITYGSCLIAELPYWNISYS